MNFNCYPLPESLGMAYGYSSFRHRHKIFVYGGCAEDPSSEYFLPSDIIHELNLFTRTWTKHLIKQNSSLPNKRVYSLMVPHGDMAYLFCGFDKMEYRICDFRGLDLNTFEFKVFPKPPVSERDKMEGWTYENQIYFFGGYGPLPPSSERNSRFTHKPDPTYHYYGWNNELVAYNVKMESWIYPSIKGEAPTGRAAYGLAQFGHRVYFMCGRRMETRCNEVHMLDLREEKWSGEIKPVGRAPVPEGRSWFACSPLAGEYVYVQGGINNKDKAISDIWLFNINTHTWSEILTKQVPTPRVACRAHLGLDGTSVIVISGRREDMFEQISYQSDQICNTDYFVLQQEPTSLKLLCLQRLHMLIKGTMDWEILVGWLPVHLQVELSQLSK